jgi:NAD(P)-dependent dehydrogenase (short-subunit alcohol dehydrogenase family)
MLGEPGAFCANIALLTIIPEIYYDSVALRLFSRTFPITLFPLHLMWNSSTASPLKSAMSTPKGCILVTGANGGLGSAIAASLAESPTLCPDYHGLYTVRRAASATVLQRALRDALPSHSHDMVEIDLSHLTSVRQAAQDINKRVAEKLLPPIRALILNAAYVEFSEQNFTPDGFDMSWQVNYLAQFTLALLLLQSMDKEHGRIIVIGSYCHE